MITFENVWGKLSKSKQYREQFALSFLKRSVPFQIRILRKKHCGSQAELALRSGLTQGVISRAEDQDYGNLTFNTVGRIAAGLDMAFIGRFVPFTGLVEFSEEFSEEEFASIRTFEEENTLRMGPVPLESVNSAEEQDLDEETGGLLVGRTCASHREEKCGLSQWVGWDRSCNYQVSVLLDQFGYLIQMN